MFIKRMLTSAVALAVGSFAAAVQAVSLGALTVESRPGEPLEAKLAIDDLDLTISPLLVRVAPPATYLREGVTWPTQAHDLKLMRDAGKESVRLRVYGKEPLAAGDFPLLIEMNAGGTVTVRTYQISEEDGVLVVDAQPGRMTVKGEPRRSEPEPLVVPKEVEAPAVDSTPVAEPAPAVEKEEAPVAEAVAEPAAKPAVEPVTAPVVEPADAPTPAPTAEVATESVPEPMPEPEPASVVEEAVVEEKVSAPLVTAPEPAPVKKVVQDVKVNPLPLTEKTSEKPVAEKTVATPTPVVTKKVEEPAVKTEVAKHSRKGRFAPNVVAEYVALNGFDASQPFTVQRDMTLWSVAKLYWPSYRGATLEQLAVAMRDNNSGAFADGDLNRIEPGRKLLPPTNAAVFGVDPVKAFLEVHHTVEIPDLTQNLIDAQKLSIEAAARVADAQDRQLTAGAGLEVAAREGKSVLEAEKKVAPQGLKVQRNMTPWSLAKKLLPNYRGATVEQVIVAIRNKNPGAFRAGNVNRLEPGVELQAPALEAVFDIDPVTAFHEVHGAATEIPAITRNLIEAQRLSIDIAAKVADAQVQQRAAGKGIEAIAREGLAVLEAERKRVAETGSQKTSSDTAKPVATDMMSDVTQEKAPDVKAEGKSEVLSEPKAIEKPAEKPVEKVSEPVSVDAGTDVMGLLRENQSLLMGVGALLLALLAFLGLRGRKKEEAEPGEKKLGVVTMQKDVPPTTEAQITALQKTVDEAVKNGTTAGAMGVGGIAYAEAQKKAASESEARQAALTKAQPWLEPDDDLPEDEAGDGLKVQPKETAAIIKGVSLDFVDDEPKAPEVAQATKTASAPMTEPASEVKPASTPKAELSGASDKERALEQALESKLKLASSFIGLGAVQEALELLDEVKRRGSEDLRERAELLKQRIKSQTENTK